MLQCHPDIVFGDIPRYYAWDYRVLRRFAIHYLTGEIIPEKLVKSMQGARDMFAATELQRQVHCQGQDFVNNWCLLCLINKSR